MKDCNHKKTTYGPDRCFSHSVAAPGEENGAAHGGITFTETCSDCGARREWNVNGLHEESSPWYPAPD